MTLILLISLTVLISLSGLFFACAEEGPIGAFTPLIALLTLYFVDWKKLVSIPAVVAAILGMAAFAVAAAEFLGGSSEESKLLSGGHLIVYLSWVFLVQTKENRHYWWICALSILQMAVASVLTTDAWFGMALLVYTFTASWTLSVFLLLRSLPAAELAAESETAPAMASGGRRAEGKSLASQAPSNLPAIGDARNGVARDVDQKLLNWRFVGSTAVVTCLSLLLSLMFFLFTPRIWIGQYSIFSDVPLAGRALTGFTSEVRLGDMGEILENSDPVMELRLFRRDSRQEFSESDYVAYLGGEPLFRGAVLDVYDSGRWQRSPTADPVVVSTVGATGDIIQEYRLQPIGTPTLFSFGNVITMRPGSETNVHILRDSLSNEYYRSEDRRMRDVIEYEAYSDTQPPDTFAGLQRERWRWDRWRTFEQYLRALSYPPIRMERVHRLAFSLIEGVTTRAEAADRIQAYLLDSSQFSYSLKLSVDDPTIDPVEDFLINRREGHCEYFASSMVMLLRSVDIPARLISGFKGGVYNRRRKAFVVQQLHAHTWVEAYIDGRWRTYDPTPEARNVVVTASQGRESLWNLLSNPVKTTWEFGIRMSRQQQQELIYRPIAETVQDGWTAITETVQGKSSGLKGLLVFLNSPERWISWQGGMLAFTLLLFLSGTVWLVRKLLRMSRIWSRTGGNERFRHRRVDFYERFQRILARHQIRQRSTQTAREFVHESLDRLNGTLVDAGFESWPDQFVDLFYRVRFGGGDLTPSEADDLDRRLSLLESRLSDSLEPGRPAAGTGRARES